MITFAGTLERRTLNQALRAHGTAARGIAVVLGVAGVGGLLFARAGEPVTWGGPLFLLLFGLFLLCSPWLSARQQMKTHSMLTAPMSGSADEDRLIFNSEFGQSSIPWAKFHRVVVKPSIVLLYVSANQFHAMPADFFANTDDWSRFKELARRRVPKPSTTRRMVFAILLWAGVIVVVFLIWSVLQTAN